MRGGIDGIHSTNSVPLPTASLSWTPRLRGARKTEPYKDNITCSTFFLWRSLFLFRECFVGGRVVTT